VIASVVDTELLVEVVWVSLVAGIGVTAAFGFALLGATRALELGRDGRVGEATLFGVLGAVAMAAVVAAIVFGIVVLVNK